MCLKGWLTYPTPNLVQLKAAWVWLQYYRHFNINTWKRTPKSVHVTTSRFGFSYFTVQFIKASRTLRFRDSALVVLRSSLFSHFVRRRLVVVRRRFGGKKT
jgi:hypothetical protein